MMIGDNREKVIFQIKKMTESGTLNAKVEIGDPILTEDQGNKIIAKYLADRNKLSFKTKTLLARSIANKATVTLNKDTEIVGLEKLDLFDGGAIITSNHFSPFDNTLIRLLSQKLKKNRINVICQQSNFAMDGRIGFLMNYADTIPISNNIKYLSRKLPGILSELFEKDELVLIYPEQEMWFNYRKPRPPMPGAYHFAAKLNVPIISCFVEMRDTDDMENENFRKVKYVLHVLDILYPDRSKSIRENNAFLSNADYELKKEAYEKIYGRELDYKFEPADIAGWTGTLGDLAQ